VRENVLKSDWVGRIVSNDQTVGDGRRDAAGKGSRNGREARPAGRREEARGDPRRSTRTGTTVHIIGFAKAMGDIAQGAAGVLVFFGARVRDHVDPALLVLRARLVITALALICAVVPVIWLLGLLPSSGSGSTRCRSWCRS
jgi:hypothetical protein